MEMTTFRVEKDVEDTNNKLWGQQLKVKPIKGNTCSSTNKTDVKKELSEFSYDKDANIEYYIQKINEINNKLKENEARLKQERDIILSKIKKLSDTNLKRKNVRSFAATNYSSLLTNFFEKKDKTEYETIIYNLITNVLENKYHTGLLTYLKLYHELLRTDGVTYSDIMDKLLDDIYFMTMIAELNSSFIQFSSDRLKNDIGYALITVAINVTELKHFPKSIRANKHIKRLNENSRFIQYAYID